MDYSGKGTPEEKVVFGYGIDHVRELLFIVSGGGALSDEAWNLLSLSYEAMASAGRAGEAQKTLSKAAENGRTLSKTVESVTRLTDQCIRGNTLLLEGDIDGALAVYKRVLEEYPDAALAWWGRAEALEARARKAEKENRKEEAINLRHEAENCYQQCSARAATWWLEEQRRIRRESIPSQNNGVHPTEDASAKAPASAGNNTETASGEDAQLFEGLLKGSELKALTDAYYSYTDGCRKLAGFDRVERAHILAEWLITKTGFRFERGHRCVRDLFSEGKGDCWALAVPCLFMLRESGYKNVVFRLHADHLYVQADVDGSDDKIWIDYLEGDEESFRCRVITPQQAAAAEYADSFTVPDHVIADEMKAFHYLKSRNYAQTIEHAKKR